MVLCVVPQETENSSPAVEPLILCFALHLASARLPQGNEAGRSRDQDSTTGPDEVIGWGLMSAESDLEARRKAQMGEGRKEGEDFSDAGGWVDSCSAGGGIFHV